MNFRRFLQRGPGRGILFLAVAGLVAPLAAAAFETGLTPFQLTVFEPVLYSLGVTVTLALAVDRTAILKPLRDSGYPPRLDGADVFSWWFLVIADHLFDIHTLRAGPSHDIQATGILVFSVVWTAITALTTTRVLEPLIPFGPFRRAPLP